MDHGEILALDSPAALVRDLDVPTRITVPAGALSLDEAGVLAGVSAARQVGEDLVVESRQPGIVLAVLAQRDALGGLQVAGATLEDVFLQLTGREYRE
jgi:ABC-2 type transport system ATP-binding protein